ncbi:MAG TPA: membrane protein insertase YidC, partial [Sphingobacteriaceae bacterium]
MDRNTFTGLFLILVILVGSTFLMKPSEEELKRDRQVQDSIARAKQGQPARSENFNANKKTDSAAAATTVDSALLKGPFGSARAGVNQPVVLENDLMKVYISPKGGRIATVELKNFKTYDGKPLILFNAEESKFNLAFTAAGTNINTSDLYFTPSTSVLKVTRNDSSSVTMRLNYSEGKYVDYVYSLKGDSYRVGFNIVTTGLESVLPANQQVSLNWEAVLHKKEKDLSSEQRNSTAYYKLIEGDVENLELSEDDKKELTEGKVQWISFKQHFFSTALIAKNGFEKGTLAVATSGDPDVVKSFAATLQLPAPQNLANYPMEFYFGPNQFKTLQDQGYDLERQVDLGYWPLKYINRYAVLPLFNFLEQFNWSYGLIILVLTIVLKVVLFPLTYKSYLSMAKMRVLKPEMEEIKAKVGEDNPTLLQQEYLKLYKKAGVNPLGGCLPMLLQLPIIMAFFFFFPNLFELRQESFLWMKDLSTYDAVITFPRIPLIGMDHISLMCILMTISTLIYTYFNNQISGVTGQMKYIGYITPIIFFGVLNSYPSGLNYYYFLANMLTFVQQFAIRQFVDDNKIHAKI